MGLAIYIVFYSSSIVHSFLSSRPSGPTPTKERRSQKLSTSRPLSSKPEPDELKPEQLIRNPAGWRGWVDKALGAIATRLRLRMGLLMSTRVIC